MPRSEDVQECTSKAGFFRYGLGLNTAESFEIFANLMIQLADLAFSGSCCTIDAFSGESTITQE